MTTTLELVWFGIGGFLLWRPTWPSNPTQAVRNATIAASLLLMAPLPTALGAAGGVGLVCWARGLSPEDARCSSGLFVLRVGFLLVAGFAVALAFLWSWIRPDGKGASPDPTPLAAFSTAVRLPETVLDRPKRLVGRAVSVRRPWASERLLWIALWAGVAVAIAAVSYS